MQYDIIIIWAWAAWLFASINTWKKLKKLILEKTDKIGTKVLLSGWERANVSNSDIEVERDYFWQNKKALKSIFVQYNQWDIQSFFTENDIEIVEEDRNRLILKSGDSKQLVSLLEKKSRQNNTEIKINSEVIKIEKIQGELQSKREYPRVENNLYKIITRNNANYIAKNIIISTWWKSFFQVWTSWDWYNFAKDFSINIFPPHRALCGMTTKQDLSVLSGSSISTWIKVLDKDKIIYEENWPLLFTHFWLSWPIIFNSSVVIWEYLNKIKVCDENEKIKYMLDNIFIELFLEKDLCTKKIYKFFEESIEKDIPIKLWLQDWRSWKEAKATWWWVDINELDKYMQSKNNPWLFFIWEVVDITWKTWWFNLQWAWSSAYSCSRFFYK